MVGWRKNITLRSENIGNFILFVLGDRWGQQMVWGLVVWIFGIPLWKGIVTQGHPPPQKKKNTGIQTTN